MSTHPLLVPLYPSFTKCSRLVTTPLFLLTTSCIVCYSNSLLCGFVFDDVSAIKDNKDIRADFPFEKRFFEFLLNDFWGIPMHKEQSHKSYRPLCVLTYRLNYLVHGLSPLGYHLGNLVLHLGVTLLYHSTLSSLLNSSTPALLAALLFSVHPVHTEAVTGVVGRAELLSSIFFLLSIQAYTDTNSKQTNQCTARDNKCKHEDKIANVDFSCSPGYKFSSLMQALFQACFLAALAMVSKEQGITVIGFCLMFELLQVQKIQKISWKTTRLIYFKGLLNEPGLVRVLVLTVTAVLLLTFRIKLMQGSSLPVFTKFDNPASVAAPVSRTLSYLVLPAYNIGLLLCPANLCCDWTMGSISLITSISDLRNLLTLFLGAYLVHTALIIFKSERSDCLPLLVSMSLLCIPFLPASNLFFPVGFVLAERVLYIPSMGFCLLVALGLTKLYLQCNHPTVKGIIKCFNEESIFLSGLTVNKNNAKLFNNVGHALESQKRHNESLILFHQAVLVQPDDIGAHINIGRALNQLGRFDEAETAYRTAKYLLPRAKPGEKLITRIAPNSLNLFLNLGNLISKNSSRLEEADRLYRQAIAMRSDYIQELGKVELHQTGIDRLLSLINLDPTNEKAYFNLGMITMDEGWTWESEYWFKKAIDIKPDFRGALFNLALLLTDQHRPLDAVPFLQSLLHYYPAHVKGLILLGDIYTNIIKDLDKAEEAYKKILDISPGHVQARHNLCVVELERGNLEAAEQCLEQVSAAAPGEEYINKHLRIIKNKLRRKSQKKP
ncbi:transmembrane and TPR repeat-containing protein CG4050 [Eurytemora carolleeae]|uniref:transmembrane and TPR repeat-containing protein CG4050 n=1 Tax=Eurytemora carolleeae TaxID=1294199 RepID=UPI000C75E1BC|nr:transmembrane and TPR repeat-containing protein CG4050 [Eurytemora carolleeae]|eukprot:XP_023344917.1 transmembrane and TPR repeat-containing protein CG4050-like [Eurytemora affinis]